MAAGFTILVGDNTDATLTNVGQVEVLEKWGEPIRYQLSFTADIIAGDLPQLVDSELNPGTEISVFVTTDAGTQCLVKGPVHSHTVRLQNGGPGSTLVVQGADNTIKMARTDRSAIWSDSTDSSVVQSIFNANGMMNVDADETDSTYSEDKHTLVQRDNDLDFVYMLARRNGCLLWITYDDDAEEIVHFKRPVLDDLAAAELSINLDEANVDQLDISWDVERPDTVTGMQVDLNSLDTMDGQTTDSGLELLGGESMASIRGEPFTTHLGVAADDVANMQSRARALLTESNWFLNASCATSVARLGDVVRSHRVINLRGAGSRYSGHYFVSGVRHLIDATSHIMHLTMVRNAW
ncbi:MAG: contractile injection system protein, VgrG/Pvc8 family [Pseudomonadota bacterium]